MRLQALDAIAQGVVDGRIAPAASVAVGVRKGGEFVFATGAAGVRSAARPTSIDPETPFDLASITKSFVAVAIARLVSEGSFGWNTPLGELMPSVSHTVSGGLPIALLLAHRAGLEAHRALFEPLTRGESIDRAAALERAAEARRPECVGTPPAEGFPAIYSDLGFLLAGAAVATRVGAPLENIVHAAVSEPLSLDAASAAAWMARSSDFSARVAPTETVGWRGGEIVGAVHDENAWALTGLGLAGHAGLFATALAVARFGAGVLDALDGRRASWLRPEDARFLVEPRPSATLRVGFDGRSDEGSSAGSAFGPHSFGHLGFTGTSLWCDPDAKIVATLLTNRVSPSRENVAIRVARPALHDALYRVGEGLLPR